MGRTSAQRAAAREAFRKELHPEPEGLIVVDEVVDVDEVKVSPFDSLPGRGRFRPRNPAYRPNTPVRDRLKPSARQLAPVLAQRLDESRERIEVKRRVKTGDGKTITVTEVELGAPAFRNVIDDKGQWV